MRTEEIINAVIILANIFSQYHFCSHGFGKIFNHQCYSLQNMSIFDMVKVFVFINLPIQNLIFTICQPFSSTKSRGSCCFPSSLSCRACTDRLFSGICALWKIMFRSTDNSHKILIGRYGISTKELLINFRMCIVFSVYHVVLSVQHIYNVHVSGKVMALIMIAVCL